MRFKFVTKFYNVLRHFPSNCNFIIIICMHMCVSIASVCKLLRTVLPTCCKNVCGQVQTTNCSTHTHTDRHTAVQSTLHDRGRFGCMQTHAHTYIIAMYVCAQGKEKTKQNTSERQTITIACARTSWLRRLCCYCAVDVLLLCCCCVVVVAGHANRSARALLALAKSSTFSFHFLSAFCF